MPDALISLSAVAVRRHRTLILREVDLEIVPGEAVGLFGANGSGKTTLLRVLATLLRPTAGVGSVLGAELGTSAVDAVRPRIGLIGHVPALAPHLTLLENLHLVADLLGIARTEADDALSRVGLAAAGNRRAGRSSNGMQKRTEFARLLLTRPDLLLLDEAHVGLDPEASQLVGHLVSTTCDRGGAAVVVSHEQERALEIVERSVTLSDGELEAAA